MKYEYTFKGNETIYTIEDMSIPSAAIKLGLIITRLDPLSSWYLQDTPFNDRVRSLWAYTSHPYGFDGAKHFEVSQRKLN